MPNHTESERKKGKTNSSKGSQTNSGGHQKGFVPSSVKSGALNKSIPPKRTPVVGSDTNSGGNQPGL